MNRRGAMLPAGKIPEIRSNEGHEKNNLDRFTFALDLLLALCLHRSGRESAAKRYNVYTPRNANGELAECGSWEL